MEQNELETLIKQIMVNQQLLKAIILMLSPTELAGMKLIRDCY